jgi:MFS transporter, UMF1 family
LLLAFAFLGASAATLFLILPSTSPVWLFSAILAALANVGFGASVVAMNAYLPALAQGSPEVTKVLGEIAELSDSDRFDTPHEAGASENVEEPLLRPTSSHETSTLRKQYDKELSNAISRISSLGIALGYGAGIVLLLVALIPVTKLHGSTFSLRLAIGLSGIWWALFSVPAAVWLPGASSSSSPSPNPAWAENSEIVNKHEGLNLRSEVASAWKRLGGMLRWREIKKLRNTFRYLAAWFLLSDGRHDF